MNKRLIVFMMLILCIFMFDFSFVNAEEIKEESDKVLDTEEIKQTENDTSQEENEIINAEDNQKEIDENIIVNAPNNSQAISINYTSHVQSYGWQKSVSEGQVSGTTGEGKRLEALIINMTGNANNIEYISYIQSFGWEKSWKKSGELTGTEGKAKRLEAIRIRLTGEVSTKYDIYYRVHSQSYGWLGWAKNGETAGTVGLAKRIEAIEIKLVEKNKGEITGNSYIENKSLLNYTSHVQNYGWLDRTTTGTTGILGKSKRMEAYRIDYTSAQYLGSIEYISYIEGKGWEKSWKNNNEISGTVGESLKLEQIKMRLTGEVANYYDVYYRVHVQGFGWLGWAKNEESAGTENIGFRIEGLEVKVVPKGTGEKTGSSLEKKGATLSYSAHVRKIGDQQTVSEGQTAGTTGQSLRMEGIKINIDTEIAGNILYKTYVDEIGWESDYKKNGELSGTTGQGKAIQLLRIKLDGALANKYDVYYRVHTDSFGWLSWAKNDEITGADCYDIQAVEVRLYLKIDSSQNLLDRSTTHIVTGFYKQNGYTYYKDKNGNQATDWIHIMNHKYFFNSLGVMIGKDVKKVMDVSAWQGDIDWDTVYKYGDIDGVILRIAAGCEQEDAKLARNIAALKRLNIPYGVYIYSYAETYNEGSTYADFTIKALNKYNMDPKIGIFLDLEANSVTNYLTNAHYEQLTKGFMDKMNTTRYGTLCKIYTYKSLAEEKMYTPYLYNQITWIAHYNHFNRYVNENVVGWQYSSEEYVPGVPTLADMSVWFVDF